MSCILFGGCYVLHCTPVIREGELHNKLSICEILQKLEYLSALTLQKVGIS
jgi:hypothetical protein